MESSNVRGTLIACLAAEIAFCSGEESSVALIACLAAEIAFCSGEESFVATVTFEFWSAAGTIVVDGDDAAGAAFGGGPCAALLDGGAFGGIELSPDLLF